MHRPKDAPAEPEYGTGDTVAWHASAGHNAGSGIIVTVLHAPGGTEYEVQRLIDGRAAGPTLVVKEGCIYPTRGVRDPRPQPAIHRHPSP
jgi:hypothetical protein